MKKLSLILFIVMVFVTSCNTRKAVTSLKAEPVVPKPPFSISVVPASSRSEGFGRSIAMAHEKASDFYVVLTNTSSEQQAVWEYGNSWGYQTISFELTAVDGKKFLVSRREEDFTRNFPSTFQIEPGEHQVYAIRFDERWDTQPSLPKADEESISLKAIYEVPPTPEAARYRVWTGRLESHTYHLKLRQW